MTASDLRPGATFPDLELPDHNGSPRRLSDVVAGDPTLVHFFRGWWCPKERTFFSGLVALQPELEVSYARIVSVSVDAPETQAAYRAGLDARWTFLSDAGRRYLDELELRETTDTVHEPYLPVAFVLFPDLRIASRYDGYWFWGRPSLEEIRQDFRAVSREIRPEWEGPEE